MKLASLAKALELHLSDLREFLAEEDLGIDPQADQITEAEAKKIRQAFSGSAEGGSTSDTDTAEYYEELEKEKQERAIRKQTKKKKLTGGAAKKSSFKKGAKEDQPAAPKGPVEIPDVISVKEFAEKTGLPVVKIIGTLMKNGVIATINQQIDFETAALISADLGVEVFRKRVTGSSVELLEGNLDSLLKEDDSSVLKPRSPIVTVMGHVDHGKTSILDVIRQTSVAAGESGGITQHIGAYVAEYNGRQITFLDTPGHEAFTEMRARGAQVTDVAVLVVAANEGVKPQTLESISHAKEAGVPVVVALNKMDLPDANPDRVKGELAEHGLQAEDWGGDTPMVPVSAHKKTGIQELLENILVVADMQNLRANPNRPAVATVIEAKLNPSLGPTATVIVNAGTLHKGDIFVAGDTYGRIKKMNDYASRNLNEALPSTPIRIAGFAEAPHVGDILQVTPNEQIARKKALEVAELRKFRSKRESASSVSQIISAIQSGKLKELKVVIKADTKGSLEALISSLSEIKNDEVTVRIIHSGVGDITESDVSMAEASGGVLLGFHVKANSLAQERAQRVGLEILIYTVIYKLIDDIKKLLSGLLEPEDVVEEIGELEVLAIFLSKKKEMIIGGKVNKGKALNHARVRIVRDKEILGEAKVTSLKHEKDSVNEIQEGKECGLRLDTTIPVQEKDLIQFFKVEKKIRTL